MSTIKEITSLEGWEQHTSSLSPSTLLIISFHAPWAAPCAQMATVLSTLASEYPVTGSPSTSWVSINAEELSDISERYNVTAVPFLVLVRGGQVLETVSGSSAAKVRAAIEDHAKQYAPTGTAGAATNGNAASVDKASSEATQADPEKQKEELFKRIGDLVKAAPVMLFMKGAPSEPKCGFSRQLVAILRENAVKYGFFNILADDEVRQGLKEFADWPTYPQLWIDGELVGGLDIVCCLLPAQNSISANDHDSRSRKSWRAMRISSSHTASRRTAKLHHDDMMFGQRVVRSDTEYLGHSQGQKPILVFQLHFV
jgi:Grx4 family monothiol glutaredoxin